MVRNGQTDILVNLIFHDEISKIQRFDILKFLGWCGPMGSPGSVILDPFTELCHLHLYFKGIKTIRSSWYNKIRMYVLSNWVDWSFPKVEWFNIAT